MTKTSLSTSRVQVFRDCKRKYLNRYVRKLQRRRFSKRSLMLGTALHDWLEHYHAGIGEPEWRDLADDDRTRVSHWAFGYASLWGPEEGCCEVDVELRMPVVNPDTGRVSRSFDFLGYLDMLNADKSGQWRIFEHKTASVVNGNYLAKLWCDSQLTAYNALCLANNIHVSETVYDVIIKSTIKQKKGETSEQFWARHAALYMTPEKYHREHLLIGEQQIADWQRDLWQTTQEILMCQRTGHWPRNTGRCYDYYSECEFAPLCMNGDNPVLLANDYEPRESREDEQQKPVEPVF